MSRYRWYSILAGRDFLKLGPVTFGLFVWNRALWFEFFWLTRLKYRLVLPRSRAFFRSNRTN